MITIPDHLLEVMKKGGPNAHQTPLIRVALLDTSGETTQYTTAYIYESNLLQNGMTVDKSCVSGNDLELGSTIASELTLKIDNTSGKFDGWNWSGAFLYPSINMSYSYYDSETGGEMGETFECLYGVYDVDEVVKSGKTITVTALDRMTWFDLAVPSSVTVGGKTVTSVKYTPYTMVKAICKACNIEVSDQINKRYSSLPNASNTFTYRYGDTSSNPSGNTYRNLLSQLGILTGVNWCMNQEGKLEFRRYQQTGEKWSQDERGIIYDYHLTPSMRWSSSRDTDMVHMLNIRYNWQGTQYKCTSTTSYNYIDVGDFTLFRDANKTSTVKNWFSRLWDATVRPRCNYYPMEASCIPQFWLEPMDRIYYGENSVYYPTIITSMTYTVNGTVELKSCGESSKKDGNSVLYRNKKPYNSFDTNAQKNLLNKAQSYTVGALGTNGLNSGVVDGNPMMWLKSTSKTAPTTSADSTATAAVNAISLSSEDEEATATADYTDEEAVMLADTTDDTTDEDEDETIEVPAEGTYVWRTDEDGVLWSTNNWQGSIEASEWVEGVDNAQDLYIRNLFAQNITASGTITGNGLVINGNANIESGTIGKFNIGDGIQYDVTNGTTRTQVAVASSGISTTVTGQGSTNIIGGITETDVMKASTYYGNGVKLVKRRFNKSLSSVTISSNPWQKVFTLNNMVAGYYTGWVACKFAKSTSKSLGVALTFADVSPTGTEDIADGVANTLYVDNIRLAVSFALTSTKPVYVWARQTSGSDLVVTPSYSFIYFSQTPTSSEAADTEVVG